MTEVEMAHSVLCIYLYYNHFIFSQLVTQLDNLESRLLQNVGLFVCLLLAAADLTRVAGIEIVAPEDSVRFTQAWFICRILSGSYLEQPYSFVLCGPKKCLLLCSSMGHSGKMMIHCFDLYSLCFVRTVYWFVFPALRPIPCSVWTPPSLPFVNSSVHCFFFTDWISGRWCHVWWPEGSILNFFCTWGNPIVLYQQWVGAFSWHQGWFTPECDAARVTISLRPLSSETEPTTLSSK